MTKQSYIYILFNKRNGTLYTGVTSDLIRRVYEHKKKLADGFTKKYNVDKLGYYEVFEDITKAIEREKQIKSGSRKNKLKLIESLNPKWQDLYEQIIGLDCHENQRFSRNDVNSHCEKRIFASALCCKAAQHDNAEKSAERQNCESNFESGVNTFACKNPREQSEDVAVPKSINPDCFTIVRNDEKPINTTVRHCEEQSDEAI